jgi:Family of unknown function (DUF6516)
VIGAPEQLLNALTTEPYVTQVGPFGKALAYVVDGEWVLRYDNEAGKGDHRHMGTEEVPYVFVSVDQLLDDFLADVATWKGD